MFQAARPILVAAMCFFASSCRHAVPIPQDVGSASFSVIEPPPVSGSVKSPGEPTMETAHAQYQEAFLASHPVLPVYPGRALAARAGAARIGVRLTIDTKGRVTGVNPSMRTVTLAPPGFAEDFRAAVEAAVRQWKFQPARIEYVETVAERGITYERVKRSEPQETELDLAFEFTAKGGVAAGK
jgi:hypothetical protein